MNTDISLTIEFIRHTYKTNEFIPLHAPQFDDRESKLVNETISSSFVSSIGKFVTQFEQDIQSYLSSNSAVAMVNGTAALQSALYLAGVGVGDLVITQSLTFVATCNTIHHLGATPIFIDVSKEHLSLCPRALENYLNQHAELCDDGICRHKNSGQTIKAFVPMHTFGHPAELDKLLVISQQWNIPLIEDAAESLGSTYEGKHTGTFGRFAAISFNGNKIITTGGGGILICHDQADAAYAHHINTTAKVAHPFEFYHDAYGFNNRLPNLNAALGCAQMEKLDNYVKAKRRLASQYQSFFASSRFDFVTEPSNCRSNYWLNAILLPDPALREEFLVKTNEANVMTRPVWQLMHSLPLFQHAERDEQRNASWLAKRLINLPSSPVLKAD